MFGRKARARAREAETHERAEDEENRRRELERKEKQRKEKQERRDRVAAWVGAAGAAIAVVGVIVTLNQNQILSDQLNAQKEALRIEGAVLVGVAKVVADYPGARLWEPDGSGIERILKAGEHASASTQVRVEVTNAGRSVGSVTSAAVQYGGGWLSADSLYCGRSVDGTELVRCDLPLIIDPGAMRVFTFQIPTDPVCVDMPRSDFQLTPSFVTATAERVVMTTGLSATLERDCPEYGGN